MEEGKVVVGQRLKSMKTRSVMVMSTGGGRDSADEGNGAVAMESEEEERRSRERRVSGVLVLRCPGGGGR